MLHVWAHKDMLHCSQEQCNFEELQTAECLQIDCVPAAVEINLVLTWVTLAASNSESACANSLQVLHVMAFHRNGIS